jgi:hypothetical protein
LPTSVTIKGNTTEATFVDGASRVLLWTPVDG